MLLAMAPTICMAQSPSAKEDRAQLAQCAAAYKVAKALLAKSPKSKASQTRFIVATDRLATATMFSNVLTPHMKYPQALHLYREVLKVDPNNNEARTNSRMIISVYQSMHRPVPKD